jgi:hypothetical protein
MLPPTRATLPFCALWLSSAAGSARGYPALADTLPDTPPAYYATAFPEGILGKWLPSGTQAPQSVLGPLAYEFVSAGDGAFTAQRDPTTGDVWLTILEGGCLVSGWLTPRCPPARPPACPAFHACSRVFLTRPTPICCGRPNIQGARRQDAVLLWPLGGEHHRRHPGARQRAEPILRRKHDQKQRAVLLALGPAGHADAHERLPGLRLRLHPRRASPRRPRQRRADLSSIATGGARCVSTHAHLSCLTLRGGGTRAFLTLLLPVVRSTPGSETGRPGARDEADHPDAAPALLAVPDHRHVHAVPILPPRSLFRERIGRPAATVAAPPPPTGGLPPCRPAPGGARKGPTPPDDGLCNGGGGGGGGGGQPCVCGCGCGAELLPPQRHE